MALPREVDELIQPKQSTVYHYTDASGLLKIVQSNELWATESHGMNDVAEIEQGWAFIVEWLERQNPKDPTVADLRSAAGSGADDYGYTYFCCASIAADDANQWRNYADGGRGFAIALKAAPTYGVVTEASPPELPENPDALERTIPGWTEFLNEYEATPWRKVLYEPDEKRRVLDSYLVAAQAERESALDPKGVDEVEWSAARAMLLGEYRADLEALARLMKGPGFAGEREVRLVVSTFDSRYAGLRAGRYGITLYQRLALAEGGEETSSRAPRYNVGVGESTGLLPIEEVWCGPLVNLKTNTRPIMASLRRGGHKDVRVIGSSVPMR